LLYTPEKWAAMKETGRIVKKGKKKTPKREANDNLKKSDKRLSHYEKID
jgi:hypothetical protein